MISSYASKLALPLAQVLLRLDGLSGDAAVLLDVVGAGLGLIARSRDYSLLGLEVVQQALSRDPDQVSMHAESGMSRALYDCPTVALTAGGPSVRLVVATHPATSSPPPVGVEREGVIYELFVSTLPAPALTCSDVLDLYLHRGSFETVLADEDVEQDPDRWCSHTPCGQECWQILSQWVWNLRLELGQKLSCCELRTTEFAPALSVEPVRTQKPAPQVQYAPPQWARPCFTGGFAGSAFALQPDGTLRCPADHPLSPQERRPERDGSLRVLYAARMAHCRPCPLRCQCQESSSSVKPRRVSAVFWPLSSPHSDSSPPLEEAADPLPLPPVLCKDWPRSRIRQGWLKVVRRESVCLTSSPSSVPSPAPSPPQRVLTRAQRAHWRLSWQQRVARNARPPDSSPLLVRLHGLPALFAQSFGFDLLTPA